MPPNRLDRVDDTPLIIEQADDTHLSGTSRSGWRTPHITIETG
jgi:hypothetical protein